MIYGEYEYNQLRFLENYGFKLVNHSNSKYSEIHLINDDVCITYHVWPQFGDNTVFVSNCLLDYQKHKYLRTYNLNWFIKNVEHDLRIVNPRKKYSFIELVVFYIENRLAICQSINMSYLYMIEL